MEKVFVFTNVKYARGQYDSQESIAFTLDGDNMSVANRSIGNIHYDEIMRQVDAGTLTITEAD
jgi:hypothetical protein